MDVASNLDNLIPSEMLSAKPSLSEILWNFSRYKDHARITLEKNPHFYSSLPADESEFTPSFTCHPLGDLSKLKAHDTVYVLVDGPECVFVERKGEKRRFGNVWALNGTLIFKGLCPLLSRPLHSDTFQTAPESLRGNSPSEASVFELAGGTPSCFPDWIIVPCDLS